MPSIVPIYDGFNQEEKSGINENKNENRMETLEQWVHRMSNERVPGLCIDGVVREIPRFSPPWCR